MDRVALYYNTHAQWFVCNIKLCSIDQYMSNIEIGMYDGKLGESSYPCITVNVHIFAQLNFRAHTI